MNFDIKEAHELYEKVKNNENVKQIINRAYDIAYKAYNFAGEYPQTSASAFLSAISPFLPKYVSLPLLSFGSAVHVGYNGLVHKDTMSNKAEIAQADYQIIASNIVHLAPLGLSFLIGGWTHFGLPIFTFAVECADKHHDKKIVKTVESFVTEGLKHYLGNEFTHSTELYAGFVTAGGAFKAGYELSSWLSAKAIQAAKEKALIDPNALIKGVNKLLEALKEASKLNNDFVNTINHADTALRISEKNIGTVKNAIVGLYNQELSKLVNSKLLEEVANKVNSINLSDIVKFTTATAETGVIGSVVDTAATTAVTEVIGSVVDTTL